MVNFSPIAKTIRQTVNDGAEFPVMGEMVGHYEARQSAAMQARSRAQYIAQYIIPGQKAKAEFLAECGVRHA